MLTGRNIHEFAVAFAQKDTFIPVVKASGDHFTRFVRFGAIQTDSKGPVSVRRLQRTHTVLFYLSWASQILLLARKSTNRTNGVK